MLSGMHAHSFEFFFFFAGLITLANVDAHLDGSVFK
jgi:hypothetical protein